MGIGRPPQPHGQDLLSKINQHFTEIARGNLLNFNVDKLGKSSISIPNDATLVLNYGLWH